MEHLELRPGDSVRAKWARAINEHRGSGLAVRVFCRERALSVTSFYRWRRRSESVRAGVGFVEVKAVADARGAGPFGRVASEGAADALCAGVRIELAGGRRIVVTRPFDRRLLADVIGALDEMAGQSGVAS